MSKSLVTIAGSPDKPLKIGGIEIPCYVVEGNKRVISQRGLYKALGITRGGASSKYGTSGGARLERFFKSAGLESLITSDLRVALDEPIVFEFKKQIYYGYDALLLQDIIRGIAKAYLKGDLPEKYKQIGKRAEELDDAFSKIGIIALIDEVTGFQDMRVRDALESIFNEILLEKAKKYELTFPVELYKQWFRLNGWEWKAENAQKRPGVLGTWTKDMIYDRMAPGLLKELERRNPKNDKGYRDHKHFQFLTDEIGEPKLREFFGGHLALAKANTSWRKYVAMVNRAYPPFGGQGLLDLPDTED